MKRQMISYEFEKVFLRRYLVKRNGEKHLMGVVQDGGDYERMGAGEDSLRSKFVVVLLMKGVVWLVTTGTCSLERLEDGSKLTII